MMPLNQPPTPSPMSPSSGGPTQGVQLHPAVAQAFRQRLMGGRPMTAPGQDFKPRPVGGSLGDTNGFMGGPRQRPMGFQPRPIGDGPMDFPPNQGGSGKPPVIDDGPNPWLGGGPLDIGMDLSWRNRSTGNPTGPDGRGFGGGGPMPFPGGDDRGPGGGPMPLPPSGSRMDNGQQPYQQLAVPGYDPTGGNFGAIPYQGIPSPPGGIQGGPGSAPYGGFHPYDPYPNAVKGGGPVGIQGGPGAPPFGGGPWGGNPNSYGPAEGFQNPFGLPQENQMQPFGGPQGMRDRQGPWSRRLGEAPQGPQGWQW